MATATKHLRRVHKNNELVDVLQNLHRPLEEHWAGRKKSGVDLDALGSDYTFKHHITRLEDIYMNHKLDPSIDQAPILGPPNVSPMSLLYGKDGLKRWEKLPDYEEIKEAREKGWNPYMIVKRKPVVYERKSVINEKRAPPPSPTSQSRGRSPSRSASPSRSRAGSKETEMRGASSYAPTSTTITFADDVKNRQEENQQKIEEEEARRSRCDDEELTEEDLIMLGMYRLNSRQAEIYKQFVRMLVNFDPHDQAKIVEDAMKDSHAISLIATLGSFSKSNIK